MAQLPHPLVTARREYQAAHPSALGVRFMSLKSLKSLRKRGAR